jgi:hypothetical protein
MWQALARNELDLNNKSLLSLCTQLELSRKATGMGVNTITAIKRTFSDFFTIF